MKVLHVAAAMDPELGEMCHAVSAVVHNLLGRGIHNEVVSLDDCDAEFLHGSKIIIHALGKGKNPWAYNKRLVPWLVTNLNYFDLVIVHGLWSYFGYAVRRAMALLEREDSNGSYPKLLVMPHGMLRSEYTHKWVNVINSVKNNLYWKYIERKLTDIADGILFISEEERILASFPLKGYNPKREFVVGFGVDPPPAFTSDMNELLRLKCPALGNNSYLLFIGNIAEVHGLDLLVKAYIDSLLKLKTEKRLSGIMGLMPKLLISGGGMDTPYGRFLLETVVQNSLTEDIIFIGQLSGQAKWGAIYGCEGFIMPSHKEYFGIEVAEALSCGKPVLISEKVLIWREIYENGACYVAQDDMAGITELLEFWRQASYKQKQALSDYALLAYKKSFTPEYATSRLLRAIKGTFQEPVPRTDNK
ncbi:MAG TPA: glycosyltransferase [Pedobacter sp.]|uniref:glycosyltransferase n=1 Tax=Pedobacter sp. TaxID=1411316 RepID=UPI002D15A4C7|nr:glycosyltransferase [Pedobacter sp.]HMI01425.1 glycosyltransferase [Pedobacter sp.]